MIERRALQAAILVFGLVPVLGGLAGAVMGPEAVATSGFQDAHYRYLSGLLLGIGLAFWAMVPRIERHGFLIRTLAGIVVLGGLARLFGHTLAGIPFDAPSLFALAMELGVTPAIAAWQARIAIASAPHKPHSPAA